MITWDYDSYLEKQIEEYDNGCESHKIGSHREYEGANEDGSVNYSTNYVYSCEECDNIDCSYWKDYHE